MNETAYIAPAAQYVMNQGVYTNNLVHTPPPTTLPTPFDNIQRAQSSNRTTGSSSSGQSPRLIDLLLPGTDLSAPPPDYMDFRPQQSDIPYQPGGYPQIKEEELELEDDVEEIIRQPDPTAEAWIMRLPSPAPSSRSSSSTDSLRSDAMQYLYKQPMLHHGSPEMLALGFDKQTCGILSVKDGPTENPWRTLVWPLARDSPALYHAISSMTAFHTSKIRPEMKVEGMEHMRQSVRHLAKGIANMRVDTALATTLVLAFSESWDVHVSSGIEHLRGAKVLVNQALTKHRQRLLDPEDLFRLKFLCNTWVYMDVIARLTTVEEDGNETDIDLWPSSDFFAPGMEIDPLMGCASTLFPLIGRVANLVRRVHKTKTNTINIISQAKDLKVLIENWRPPEFFEPPEDPDSEIQDSLQTAEAYRWATLLYLHQAVPEIPSLSSAALAKEVLVHLALVPASSRAIIVHIYPLLAAGCEATIAEDRTWVEDRWTTMSQRMLIGNIDRCLEVVKEVWARRDADALAKLQLQALRRPAVSRLDSAYTSPVLSLKRAFSMAEESPTDAQFLAWTDASGGAGGGGAKRRATMQIGRNGPVPMPVRAASKDLSSAAGLEVEVDDAEFERTVRGRLHWVGVMKDWDWEGSSSLSCSRLFGNCRANVRLVLLG